MSSEEGEKYYELKTHITWSRKAWSFKLYNQSWIQVYGIRKHFGPMQNQRLAYKLVDKILPCW